MADGVEQQIQEERLFFSAVLLHLVEEPSELLCVLAGAEHRLRADQLEGMNVDGLE